MSMFYDVRNFKGVGEKMRGDPLIQFITLRISLCAWILFEILVKVVVRPLVALVAVLTPHTGRIGVAGLASVTI